MKIKGLVNNVVGEFDAESVEIVNDENEPITFNSKQELDDYIGSVVIQYLEFMTEEE